MSQSEILDGETRSGSGSGQGRAQARESGWREVAALLRLLWHFLCGFPGGACKITTLSSLLRMLVADQVDLVN